MTLMEIPVLPQGILSRPGIKRLVMKISNAFKGTSLSKQEGSLFVDVPGSLTPTEILKTAEADFAQKCCLHEFTYIGDRITTFYICDWCKRRQEGAWQWVTNRTRWNRQYDLFSDALDELEKAAAEIQIPMPPKTEYEKFIVEFEEVTTSVPQKNQPKPFHLGGALESIERIQ